MYSEQESCMTDLKTKIDLATDFRLLALLGRHPGKEVTINAGAYGFKCTADGFEINPHIKCSDFFDSLDKAGLDPQYEMQDAEFGYSFVSKINFRLPANNS
jgi:hypothetical protein